MPKLISSTETDFLQGRLGGRIKNNCVMRIRLCKGTILLTFGSTHSKVEFSLQQVTTAQRGSRGIALLFL